MYAVGARQRNLGVIRFAAILTVIGIIINRLNVTIIAFNWYSPQHYIPSWMEIVVTLAIIFTEIWVFRLIVTRMPVYESEGTQSAHA
jgi:Ni/Fe-hydrogenase subunit HybB-like protein